MPAALAKALRAAGATAEEESNRQRGRGDDPGAQGQGLAHVDLPEGTVEEEHGRQAFTGRASHLYRTAPPTAWVKVEGRCGLGLRLEPAGPARPDRPRGRPLVVLSNRDLTVLVSRCSAPMPFFVRDADGDVVYFVHRGQGTLETDYGPWPSGPATTWSCPRAPPTGWSRPPATTSSC